jgi:uncharacterized protein (TIGR04562 family)
MASHTLPWEALSALVYGVSVIDLASTPIYSYDEAVKFILSYGYDWNHSNDAEALCALGKLAIQFVEQTLLPSLTHEQQAYLRLPESLKQRLDIPQLMLQASQSGEQRTPEAMWACAILKVLHTLVHIDNSPKLHYVRLAKDQILKAYRHVLTHDPARGGYFLHSSDKQRFVPLVNVEIKELKSRDSLLIKLLSKKSNMVEDIDDLIGLRFITHHPEDCLLALAILIEERLVVYSNTKPTRSRNSLIGSEHFKRVWESTAHTVTGAEESTKIHTWQALEQLMGSLLESPMASGDGGDMEPLASSELSQSTKADQTVKNASAAATPQQTPASFTQHNPHSSDSYRGLHITTRHLLRIRRMNQQRDERVFFPYELQFVDAASFSQNQEGDAHHSRYKQRQLQRCKRRVLGELMAWYAGQALFTEPS